MAGVSVKTKGEGNTKFWREAKGEVGGPHARHQERERRVNRVGLSHEQEEEEGVKMFSSKCGGEMATILEDILELNDDDVEEVLDPSFAHERITRGAWVRSRGGGKKAHR